uniref:Uncharacterized protein n=1 Tax=Rhizophora mucronata TaxID=61149 RepID=A0A2P2NG99_RHIMU
MFAFIFVICLLLMSKNFVTITYFILQLSSVSFLKCFALAMS